MQPERQRVFIRVAGDFQCSLMVETPSWQIGGKGHSKQMIFCKDKALPGKTKLPKH